MAIQFLCPHCNKQFRTADELAGKLTKCKQCGQTMRVPELASFGAGDAPAASVADSGEITSFPEVDAGGAPIPDSPAPAAEEPAEEGGFQIKVGGPALGKRPFKMGGGSPSPSVSFPSAPSSAPFPGASSAPFPGASSAQFPGASSAQFPGASSAQSPGPAVSAPVEQSAGGMPQIQVGSAAPSKTSGPASPSTHPKPGTASGKGSSPTYFNVNKGTVTLIVLGVVLLGLGGYEASTAMESSGTAKDVTVPQAVSSGGKGNRHVTINKAYLWTEGKMMEGSETKWTRVWIPIIDSRDPELAKGGTPRVLMFLRTKHVPNATKLQEWGARTRFSGMILDGSDLPNSERSKLNGKFPELTGKRVLLLDEGEKPPSPIFMAVYLILGVLSAAGGAYLMFLSPPIEGM